MNQSRPLLAFDVYGTLIDTSGIAAKLKLFFPEAVDIIMPLWRQKQLEYSFRRSCMKVYVTFPVCTAQALDFACQAAGCELTDGIRQDLLSGYRKLPPFPDVVNALTTLHSEGFTMVAFSNGMPDDLKSLFAHASISRYFDNIVSVDAVEDFKPAPSVYQHLLSVVNKEAKECFLISSNSFDVLGALSVGMGAMWLQRNKKAIFDPWARKPDAVIRSLLDLSMEFK